MASPSVGESQLQRIIRDLHDAVTELGREHREGGEPVTDDSSSLHKFCYKLEYLLQFDQKEKATLLGTRKDYWDYFCHCLAKIKGANDGIRFVKSIPELKTSLGKGRAFIRYSLAHQRLADTLQQCLMNQRVTSDWYYSRSPFLKPQLNVDIINHLYELNEIQFDVASRGHDLDSAWPTFARRTLGLASPPGQPWKTPSRSSSINSLASTFSQAPEFLSSPDCSHAFLSDPSEAPSGSAAEDLRVELDQSELRQRELQERLRGQEEEAAELRGVVKELRRQLEDRLREAEREREERAGLAERLGEEVRRKEADLRESEARLEALRERAARESSEALRQAEELQGAIGRLQGALSGKEKESGDLQGQLQELHSSLEARERQAEELKRRTQEEKEELLQRYSSLKDSLEGQLQDLTEQLRAKEKELSASARRVQDLEKQVESLAGERDGLRGSLAELEGSLKEQAEKTGEYKAQCASLTERNGKLLETAKRNEEAKRELAESRAALEGELAALRASEKQLRGQLEDGAVSLDERERKLREENRRLDESFQKAALQREAAEGAARTLERESGELREELVAAKAALVITQDQLQAASGRIPQLERTEEDLQARLQEEAGRCAELQGRLEALGMEKDEAEAGLKETLRREAQEAASRLSLAEGQLELNAREVSRLQDEVVELRAKLRGAAETEGKARAQLEVAEASREELRALAEQLQGQLEELNRGHVEELQRCKLEEEALAAERDGEARARADLASEAAGLRDELASLKQHNKKLALEVGEARDGLHRANTEMAELGITVCALTSENEEARQKWASVSARLQELEEEGAREVDRLTASMEALQEENAALRGELEEVESLRATVQELQGRLERAETEAREEVTAIKFQMSSETMSHQNQLQSQTEELVGVRAELEAEHERAKLLEAKVCELEAANSASSQQLQEKGLHISQSEVQLQSLRESLARREAELAEARSDSEELRRSLDRAAAEKQACDMKTSAEIDDLYRTKKNLEERLIQLIMEKDALWQKSDALEFEQKLRAEEVMERDPAHCVGCQSQFSWWLRRHQCGLCGRAFCYYCCSQSVSGQGVRKERRCRDCHAQHSAATARHPQGDAPDAPDTPTSPLSPCRPPHSSPGIGWVAKPDDGVFDIITEEEVNGVYDTESLTRMTGECLGGERDTQRQGTLELSTSTSTDATPDDPEEPAAVVQDAEIHLLKSGELTLTVPLTAEEIAQFGDGSRELFIKSSCYSLIPVTVSEAGHTISWVFSSEPKSISFSVVYRETPDTPLEQAKVLIPLTRCSSHKETIQGQLKVRNAGTYTLIFDNSFSRFISKKVLYRLTVEKPVIYDGSDIS
ncbi:FYVE and coiled-coil domain-containing protein 1-like [Megalops cyprinoides]|uniref:FYVE and coiled-coil domain-containing protein 1-like n=1 Tax=Megalops cyprinoides TaxID=118141 RepID=UPI0018644072|nr:FYVE and coiled-coil domain-containing protein 1-like [Megalops cyprinoides]